MVYQIIFLPKTHYVNGDTVVLGVCGWWDYNKRDPASIEDAKKYFGLLSNCEKLIQK